MSNLNDPHFIRHYDVRSDNRWEIHLTPQGHFYWCRRYVCQTLRDPIDYHSLDDIPEPMRTTIEHLIHDKTKPS